MVVALHWQLIRWAQAYFADESRGETRPPVFSKELGLAVEALRGTDTIAKLWSVS